MRIHEMNVRSTILQSGFVAKGLAQRTVIDGKVETDCSDLVNCSDGNEEGTGCKSQRLRDKVYCPKGICRVLQVRNHTLRWRHCSLGHCSNLPDDSLATSLRKGGDMEFSPKDTV